MRSFINILILTAGIHLSVFAVNTYRDNQPGDIINSVVAALRTGNASALAVHFSSTIDLTVPGSEGTYSKTQAELIVKNFFSTNKPSDFKINYQGSSGATTQFCVGTLTSQTGNFRTYFLIKTINEISQITQLQFEEE